MPRVYILNVECMVKVFFLHKRLIFVGLFMQTSPDNDNDIGEQHLVWRLIKVQMCPHDTEFSIRADLSKCIVDMYNLFPYTCLLYSSPASFSVHGTERTHTCAHTRAYSCT